MTGEPENAGSGRPFPELVLTLFVGPNEEQTPNVDELDDGIHGVVAVLQAAGVDTFSSCQGGGPSLGHHFVYPVVWFRGDAEEGKRAEMIVREAGYQVSQLSRIEYERQGERVAPFWELQFVPGAANTALPLDALRAQIGRLREALKPFADAADDDGAPDNAEIWEAPAAMGITFGDLRRARAILAEDTKP